VRPVPVVKVLVLAQHEPVPALPARPPSRSPEPVRGRPWKASTAGHAAGPEADPAVALPHRDPAHVSLDDRTA
jgi:hypothetical protein